MSYGEPPERVVRRDDESQLDIFAAPQANEEQPSEEPAAASATLAEGTDCAFLFSVLSDGLPHTLNEIHRRSFSERGCGLTVHSRVSDLRTKHGYVIEHLTIPNASRGEGHAYQLVSS